MDSHSDCHFTPLYKSYLEPLYWILIHYGPIGHWGWRWYCSRSFSYLMFVSHLWWSLGGATALHIYVFFKGIFCFGSVDSQLVHVVIMNSWDFEYAIEFRAVQHSWWSCDNNVMHRMKIASLFTFQCSISTVTCSSDECCQQTLQWFLFIYFDRFLYCDLLCKPLSLTPV